MHITICIFVGDAYEGEKCRCTVDPRIEDMGGVGCKRLVKINQMVADGGGGRMQDKGEGEDDPENG